MKSANHVQLGNGLETGATHAGTPAQAPGPVQDTHLELVRPQDGGYIRRQGRIYAASQLVVEVIDGKELGDEARVADALRDTAEACGGTLLHLNLHVLPSGGVSGVAILTEGHISVHSWPDIGYGAFDLFWRGGERPWRAIDCLREAFGAGEVRAKELRRGEGIVASRL